MEEFQAKMSHREFRTRIAWNQENLNLPDRSDYYLMQIAGCVAHVLSRNDWKVSDYLIKFKGPQTEADRKVQAEQAKSTWRKRLGRMGRRSMYGR